MEDNIIKENKKTIKGVLTSLFITIIALVSYGYLFSVALRLLNRANTVENAVGFVLLFVLGYLALFWAYLTYINYKKPNPKKEDKTNENV